MNTESMIILIVVASFIFLLAMAIFLKGLKIKKSEKKETPKPKEEPKKVEVEKVEEKPLPVGIIKSEITKEGPKVVEDFAPLREKKTATTEKVSETKSVSQQIKDLSPEMKAILFSDVIKPKF